MFGAVSFALQNYINLYVIVPGLLVMVVLLWRMRHTRSLAYRVFFALFWVYLLVLLSLTVFSVRMYRSVTWDDRLEMLPLLLSRVNLAPLYFGRFPMLGYIFIDVVVNNLVTVPLGFGLAYLKPMTARKMLLAGAATGLFFEIGQLVTSLLAATPARVTDINDVIFNALGMMVGYGAFLLFRCWVPQKNGRN
ncbi:MAG TPA: VanZ family protein [Levilinea sp.]|nr:VanZ family protein [Levilinea sp.]